ncbi:MAG: hypothetical protein DVB23_002046 [Verrucomicrobia bacterium]|jgi:hypothetical protein|nr:MAG: hypothetical protein DVB23_002046 [Verrucomicrobiota bacterium]
MFASQDPLEVLKTFHSHENWEPNSVNTRVWPLLIPSVAFAESLYEISASSEHHAEHIPASERSWAGTALARAGRLLLQALGHTYNGDYVSACSEYRHGVESLFQSTYTYDEVWARLDHRRGGQPANQRHKPTPADYRRVLCKDPATKSYSSRLYRVYDTLSKKHHNMAPDETIHDHLPHNVLKGDFEKASKLANLMTRGNLAAGEIIRHRLHPLFIAASLDRTARFDGSLAKLKELAT